MAQVVITHDYTGAWGAYHLLILVEDQVSDGGEGPKLARLVHDRIESHYPLEEEVLREELMLHISVDLLLILVLGRRIPVEIVCLQDLHDLLTVDWPVLEGADSNLVLTLEEVLF